MSPAHDGQKNVDTSLEQVESPIAAPKGLEPISGPILNPPLVVADVEKGVETASIDGEKEEITYPEGGREAWLVVFGCFCGLAASLGYLNTIAPIHAYISDNQLSNYSPGSISWIFSVFVFIVFFCGLQIGPIFDARGPRMLVFIGTVLTVASAFILSVCKANIKRLPEYYQFMLTFGVLGGFGVSLMFTPGVAAIAHYFNEKRATMTGLAVSGGGIGGIIFPLMFQSLLPKVGYAWSIRIIAFVILFLAILANIFIRSRLPPKETNFKSMLPDFKIFLDGTGAFALVTVGVFLFEWGLFVPTTYLTSYAVANGVGEKLSFQMIAIFNAASVFGRIIPGYGADILGRFNAMLITLAMCAISVFALWWPASGNVPLIIIFSILFGFSSGSNISITPICVGQLCEVHHYGRYYATCYTIVSFATLTGIPIAGALIERCNGSYYGVILFTGLCYLGSMVAFGAVRVRKAGWSLRARW